MFTSKGLSLTPETYSNKMDPFHEKYIDQIVPFFNSNPQFHDEHVKKCASEILFHDLFAIADKEKYDPKYQFPVNTSNPGMSFHIPLVNCGLIPDPVLASSLFDNIRVMIIRIVLYLRSFSLFNKNANEAHELLGLYNKVKAGAAARLILSKQGDFRMREAIYNSGNWRWLCDLDWRLFSLGSCSKEMKEEISLLTLRIHCLRGQKAMDGFESNCIKNESFAEFLTKVQLPLRNLMFLRQQLFIEIIEAAENYTLFGRAKPLELKSAQKHRQMMEEVLKILKEHHKINYETSAQNFYKSEILGLH